MISRTGPGPVFVSAPFDRTATTYDSTPARPKPDSPNPIDLKDRMV